MRVFDDPDAFARLVTENLGAKVDYLPVAFDQLAKFGALARLHIPLLGNIADGRQHFGFAGVTIEPHQRGIGAQLPAIGAGSIGPDR